MSEVAERVKHEKFENGELLSFIHMGTGKAVLEDAISLISSADRIQLLVLTDGMGGHNCGDKASEVLHSELLAQSKKFADESYISHHVLEAIGRANQRVKDLKSGAGATLAVVELGKDYVRCYHSGDTKILVLGSRGAVRYSSIPHSPRGFALASGALKANSTDLPAAHLVSNGLGFETYTVEVSQKIEVANNDIIFLSSDLIPDVLPEAKLVELLTSDSFEKRGENLLRKLLDKEQGQLSNDCSFQIFKISINTP